MREAEGKTKHGFSLPGIFCLSVDLISNQYPSGEAKMVISSFICGKMQSVHIE